MGGYRGRCLVWGSLDSRGRKGAWLKEGKGVWLKGEVTAWIQGEGGRGLGYRGRGLDTGEGGGKRLGYRGRGGKGLGYRGAMV